MDEPSQPQKRGRGRPPGSNANRRRTLAEITEEAANSFLPPGGPGAYLPKTAQPDTSREHEKEQEDRRDSLRSGTSLQHAKKAKKSAHGKSAAYQRWCHKQHQKDLEAIKATLQDEHRADLALKDKERENAINRLRHDHEEEVSRLKSHYKSLHDHLRNERYIANKKLRSWEVGQAKADMEEEHKEAMAKQQKEFKKASKLTNFDLIMTMTSRLTLSSIHCRLWVALPGDGVTR